MYTVSPQTTQILLATGYVFDENRTILMILGRNVAEKVSSQIVLYFPTSRN